MGRLGIGPIGRRVPRRHFSQPATLLMGSGDVRTGYPCNVIDVSELGMRITTAIPLEREQEVEVVLDTGARPRLAARVTWVGEPGSPNFRHAGLIFLAPVAPGFWENLLRKKPGIAGGLPLPAARARDSGW